MLPDETPPGAFEIDLAAALDGHSALVTRLDELGDEPLDALLQHARATVPFYRNRGARLADFPLMDRDTMRDRRAELISSSHGAAIDHLWARTNGTLAPWLPVGFDAAAFYELFLFTFARIVASRDGLREALVPGEVGIHYLHDEPADTRLTSYIPALGGVLLRRLPFGRGPEDDGATIRELRAAAPPILYAKAPMLLRALEVDRSLGGGRVRPRIIVTSGATLYPRDRRAIEDWFGCTIVNAYAATEAGLIAVECPGGLGMHVQDDRLLVEILTEDDELVAHGRGELVITNFINWAQPFIRYRLDDRGTLAPACPCGWEGPTIVELRGRDVQAYDVPGPGRVASSTLAAILDRDDIRQFEVSQAEARTPLLVRWIPAVDARPLEITAEVEGALREVLGDSFELRQVERITIAGGKGLRFVRKPRFAPVY